MNLKNIEETLELLIQFDKRGGTVPTIVQDSNTGAVLMLAYSNALSLETTIKTGYATFWSTSKEKLWKKGETSGDLLRLVEVLVDCDQDALIYRVWREGSGACHTLGPEGKTRPSCFYRVIDSENRLRFL